MSSTLQAASSGVSQAGSFLNLGPSRSTVQLLEMLHSVHAARTQATALAGIAIALLTAQAVMKCRGTLAKPSALYAAFMSQL